MDDIAARICRITDAHDARIQEFVNLRERDLTGRGNYFIAEGKVVLQQLALAHGAKTLDGRQFKACKFLILENRLSGACELLRQFPQDIPIYVCDKATMDAIAGFSMHRGVLALGQYCPQRLDRDRGDFLLLASGISNHDNLGSIFRNAAAFCVDQVLLDQTCCHPLYRKSIRVSVGAVLNVPFQLGLNMNETISSLYEADYQIFGLSPHGGCDLAAIEKTHGLKDKKIAVIVGAEGEGLSDEILARVIDVRIAQARQLDSLNVATATGIALWQFANLMGRLD